MNFSHFSLKAVLQRYCVPLEEAFMNRSSNGKLKADAMVKKLCAASKPLRQSRLCMSS